MELRQLRSFVRAAELLHFTRAAESLGISQPALSNQIAQLEEELQTDLFARIGRQVKLTESGAIFLVSARKLVLQLETSIQDIDSFTNLMRGELSLATTPLFGSMLLPPSISIFAGKYPNIKIQIQSMRAEDVEDAVVSGRFHIGFSMLPKEHADLQQVTLLAEELSLIVSKDHPLAKKSVITADDLIDVPFVWSGQKLASGIGPSIFKRLNLEPKIMIESNDGHPLLELVKSGKFVTFFHPSLAIRKGDNLCAKPVQGELVKIEFGAVWTHLSPAARAFLDIMIKSTKGVPPTST